jgi:hypothetical protein
MPVLVITMAVTMPIEFLIPLPLAKSASHHLFFDHTFFAENVRGWHLRKLVLTAPMNM